MSFKLQITEATGRKTVFVKKKDKKTGKEKSVKILTPYKITFNSGQWATIIERAGQVKVSVKAPGPPLTNWFGHLTGERGKEQLEFPSSPWDIFEREYAHCGMPQLVLQGLDMVDAEREQEQQEKQAS